MGTTTSTDTTTAVKGSHGGRFVKSVTRVINPEQAKVSVVIFELYRDGKGYTLIAQKLNKRGVASSRGPWKSLIGGWNHSDVRHILQNSQYIGRPVRNKSETYRLREGQIRHRWTPESNWIYSGHLPEQQIISDELWEAVRHANSMRQDHGLGKSAQSIGGSSRTAASRRYLFSGLCTCGACGTDSMNLFNGPEGYYHCDNYRLALGCTNKLRIKRTDLERALIDEMAAALRMEFTVDELTALVVHETRKEFRRLKALQEKASDRSHLLMRKATLESAVDDFGAAIEELGSSTSLAGRLVRAEAELEEVMEELEAKTRTIREFTDAEIE